MTTPKPPNPPPGSPEAVALGCLCPVMDNHNGEGSGLTDAETGDQFHWINQDCPVHVEQEGKPNA